MSELGSVPAPSPAEAERSVHPPEKPSTTPPRKTSSWDSFRVYVELPSLAALGATFGFLTGMGLWSEIHEHSVDFVLWAACLGLAAYVLFDPAMDALYDWLGAKRPEFPEGRKKVATLMAALATVLVSAFHHSLDVSFETEFAKFENRPEVVNAAKFLGGFSGWGLVVLIFLAIGLGAWFITQGWARGAQHQPPRAARYGAVASGIAGLIVISLLLGYLSWTRLLNSRVSIIGIGLLGLLWFMGPGILGGWAINKQRQQEAESSPTQGILGHLAIFSGVYVILLLVVARALEGIAPESKDTIEAYIWLPIAALISQNLGWALAPYFRREFCDTILRSSTAPATAEGHSDAKAGAAVLEIPRRDGSPTTSGAGVAAAGALVGAGAAAAMAHSVKARELFFRPKGDRLWATLGLLLSLATSAAAYHLGTLRKDTDISANVVKNFQQDSGLQSSGLNAQANDHIVTLTGTVSNEAEHQAAVRRALGVRGVKQLIDDIHVAPAPPVLVPHSAEEAVTSPAGAAGEVGPAASASQPAANIDVTVPIGKAASVKTSVGIPAKANGGGAAKANSAVAAKPSSVDAAKAAAKNALTTKGNGTESATVKPTGTKTTATKPSDIAGVGNTAKKLNPLRLLKKKNKNGQ